MAAAEPVVWSPLVIAVGLTEEAGGTWTAVLRADPTGAFVGAAEAAAVAVPGRYPDPAAAVHAAALQVARKLA